MCYGRCGIVAHVQNGKLTKVEGDPDAPHTEGRICTKGLAIPQLVNHPDRLLHPLKRTNPKGERSDWQRISWKEAYDIITERFLEIKERHGARSIFRSSGTGRDMLFHLLYTGFWNAFDNDTWVKHDFTFVFQINPAGQLIYCQFPLINRLR